MSQSVLAAKLASDGVLTLMWLFVLINPFVVAAIAHKKGRNVPLWFLYGLGTQAIALLHASLMGSKEAVLERRQLADGSRRKCPHCAEMIKADAKVCRFCGRDVPE